jgi:pimeloyl-ACP methyl ester carboxylesterase
MLNPAIVIVPGSFSPASMYSNLVDALQKHNYNVRVVELPSVGDSDSATGKTMYDDAKAIQATLALFSGRDIVIVAHSYGGVPATEASKGFLKVDGKEGGVVKIVYMTAVVPLEGANAQITTQSGDEPAPSNTVAVNVCPYSLSSTVS